MATITKEQALKRQAAAPENWVYDFRHYVLWGENQLQRKLLQDDGSMIIATVGWQENRKTCRNDYGCTWTVPAGNYTPVVGIRRWTERGSGSDVWTSSGFGISKKLTEEKFARRNYKDLCKFAATVPDDLIIELYRSRNLQETT